MHKWRVTPVARHFVCAGGKALQLYNGVAKPLARWWRSHWQGGHYIYAPPIIAPMPTPPRLYSDQPLASGKTVPLTAAQAHYVLHVLRLGDGDGVRVFNGRDGEYCAGVVASAKSRKSVAVMLGDQSRRPRRLPPLVLGFGLVRRPATEAIIRQATELGATEIQPLATQFTAARRINTARLKTIAIEAAEQCDRLSVPSIAECVGLADFLAADKGGSRYVLFCDETGAGRGIANILAHLTAQPPPAAVKPVILLGPEGGFSPQEREILLAHKGVYGVSLGQAILRADTAAVVALGAWRLWGGMAQARHGKQQ